MRKAIDLIGERFGRLVAVRDVGALRSFRLWLLRCDCGAEIKRTSADVRSKKVQSCGCLHSEIVSQRQKAKKLPIQIIEANRKANAERQRLRRRDDPLKAMQARLSRLHRHALAQVGAIKSSPTFLTLGYTAAEFVSHIERQFQAGIGWHNMKDWQIDHIVPICSAKNEADVVLLNQLSNLRPMWAKENNSKKAKRIHLL
jgi:hypothetical protein